MELFTVVPSLFIFSHVSAKETQDLCGFDCRAKYPKVCVSVCVCERDEEREEECVFAYVVLFDISEPFRSVFMCACD